MTDTFKFGTRPLPLMVTAISACESASSYSALPSFSSTSTSTVRAGILPVDSDR